jgi:hypothetical protein
VAASANRSLPSFTTEPAVAGPNSDRSKVALTRNFIEKSPESLTEKAVSDFSGL